jgi:hypothetical protein
MKTLTATLEAAQKKRHRRPHVEAYVHDLERGVARLSWFRYYTGTEPESHHDIAIDGNGRMHRIRVDGTTLYRQRSSGSTFPEPFPYCFTFPLVDGPTMGSWQTVTTGCAGPCAIAASGSIVYIFWRTTGNVIGYVRSTNGGTSWGSPGTLASYADVLSLAAAWWTGGTGVNVVCFTLKVDELSAIVWDSGTDTLVVQRIVTFTGAHPYQITNTFGIGATYDAGEVRMHVVFAARRTVTPYDTYELVRTQLSPTHFFAAMESFVVVPEDPLDTDLLRHEYPDCHVPVVRESHDAVRITMVEKFTGVDPYKRPLTCHSTKDTTFLDAAYTEPRPFIDLSSDYGLRMASTSAYWLLSRPDGLWHARRALRTAVDLSGAITSFRLSTWQSPALTLHLDNSDGRFASPGTDELAALRFRSEVELRLGYRTPAGAEVVDGGRFWVDSWEYNSLPVRDTRRANRATFTIYALDGWGLADRWTPRYQLRWNHAGTPANVWQILFKILARLGIRLRDGAWPRSSAILNFYPDYTLVPGQRGDNAIRRLLATVPDQLVFRGQDAFVKNPISSEAASYEYAHPERKVGAGEHPIEAGRYGDAVTPSWARVIGRDSTVYPPDQVIADDITWELQELYDQLIVEYDPNLATYAEAVTRAASILRRLSLDAQGAEILVPANVGQELADVVAVTDWRAGIVSAPLRVSRLATAYDRQMGRYDQSITLGAP